MTKMICSQMQLIKRRRFTFRVGAMCAMLDVCKSDRICRVVVQLLDVIPS